MTAKTATVRIVDALGRPIYTVVCDDTREAVRHQQDYQRRLVRQLSVRSKRGELSNTAMPLKIEVER